jgi:epoxyqueuosine reductase
MRDRRIGIFTNFPKLPAMPDKKLLTQQIREEAIRLGFFKIGVTPVRVLPDSGHFREWLGRGMHGEMSYMERQAPKRENPCLIFANARTILVLAMNYYTEDPPVDSALRGRISRYAWGKDYHGILLSRLEKLLGFIRSRCPDAHGLCYVDTGPIMEKVWGAQTALGWMGKHTNLITREQGSWFFIGVMLLDTELDEDGSAKDFCGKCIRCSNACPTGAIVAPYVLDARLCISYLTIELRGPIPHNLRKLIGNRIYGCDDCQEVCPWNRFAVKSTESLFLPPDKSLAPDLISLVCIDQREFKARFQYSPILRATRDGFLRNVVVALGNSGRTEAVPALEEALHDSSVLVRSHAAWALGQIATEEACGALEKAQAEELDSAVLEEIRLAIGPSPK